MTKNHKRILSIVIIILVIFLLFIIIKPFLHQKVLENAKYSSISDIPNNQAAVSIMKCKYIKEEQSTSSDYYLDIYLEFGELLYDGEKSNEIYFSQLIQLVAQVNKYINFRLIDEKNNIIIAVICSENEIQQTIINGDSNYYGKAESLKQLEQFTRPKITEVDIQSELLQNLIDNNWDVSNLDLEQSEKLEDNYDLYPETGLKVSKTSNKVFNIIFMDIYEDTVVNGLNAKSSFEDVIQTLGEPTFGSIEEQTIGYKSSKLYVFFTEDEVSIYRLEKYNSTEFEKEIEKYNEQNDIKTFISNITDIWPDYNSYYYDSNTIDLSYILKGVKIQYGVYGNHGITFYTNYTGKLNNKEIEELAMEEMPKEIYFKNSDLVEEYEMERAEKHRLILYSEDIEQEEYF